MPWRRRGAHVWLAVGRAKPSAVCALTPMKCSKARQHLKANCANQHAAALNMTAVSLPAISD